MYFLIFSIFCLRNLSIKMSLHGTLTIFGNTGIMIITIFCLCTRTDAIVQTTDYEPSKSVYIVKYTLILVMLLFLSQNERSKPRQYKNRLGIFILHHWSTMYNLWRQYR